jgi:hypothetical protein
VTSGTNSELGVGSNSESGTRPVGSAVVALSGPLAAMSCGSVTMSATGVGVRRAGSRDEVCRATHALAIATGRVCAAIDVSKECNQ